MTASKRFVKVGDTVRLKTSERKFSKLSYGQEYKVEGIEPNNGYWDGSSYITVLSDKDNKVITLRMYENFFDIVDTVVEKGSLVESKFKIGDKVIAICDTPSIAEGWIGYVTRNTPLGDYEVFAEGETGTETFYTNELELLSVSQAASKTAVKSNGGSSSYYELTITNKTGESIKCETGDVIRALVGNDFDFGNCVKALRRMYLATLGMGKEGTDIPYDANKVRYFLSEIERVNK